MSLTLSKADTGLRQELIIGRITGPHGLKGAVRVQVLTDQPERFLTLTSCLLLDQSEKLQKKIELTGSSLKSPGLAIVSLADLTDRQAAEKLRGCWLAVERSAAISLPADHWFICDLVGCQVYDEKIGLLGQLSDVLQLSANDVYVVSSPGEKDLLVPVLKQVLRQVDLAGRRIDVALPEGLYEIYRQAD